MYVYVFSFSTYVCMHAMQSYECIHIYILNNAKNMSDCNEYLHDGDETDSKAHNSGYGHGHPKEPRK